jgi:hypothetical protein
LDNDCAALKLKVSDVIQFGINPDTATPKPLEVVQNIIPEITLNKLGQLVDACMKLHQRYKNNFIKGKKPEGIENLISSNKKIGKKVRKIFEGKISIMSRNIVRYGEITETVPSLELSKVMNSIWGYNFMDNKIRTFAFKLFNNVLGINTRVRHFVRNHTQHCTFCTLARDPDLGDESINHLFQDCPQVEPMVLGTIRWFWQDVDDTNRSRRDYMCGIQSENIRKNMVWNVFVVLLKYYIWECKLTNRVPVHDDAKIEIADKFLVYCSISNFFSSCVKNLNGLPQEILREL